MVSGWVSHAPDHGQGVVEITGTANTSAMMTAWDSLPKAIPPSGVRHHAQAGAGRRGGRGRRRCCRRCRDDGPGPSSRALRWRASCPGLWKEPVGFQPRVEKDFQSQRAGPILAARHGGISGCYLPQGHHTGVCRSRARCAGIDDPGRCLKGSMRRWTGRRAGAPGAVPRGRRPRRPPGGVGR